MAAGFCCPGPLPRPLVLRIHSQLYPRLCITSTGYRIPGESICLADTGHIQPPSYRKGERKFKCFPSPSLFLFQTRNLQQTRRWSMAGFFLSSPLVHTTNSYSSFSRVRVGTGKVSLGWCYHDLVLLLSGVTAGVSACWAGRAGVQS